MFYSQCLMSRKGPLGAIWVAAYFFKKLKKAQVNDTHIPSSVDQILQKELDALTYRVLAYLLLGVVRIYSKKVDFLFDDCNKVLIGVKEFVAKEKNREKTTVSLPASAGCFSIALPERFELDAFDLGVLDDFHGGNSKLQEDITLKDGGGETECMDQYSMERFDMEENLLFTFQDTFFADHDETKHESFAHDMDICAESVRDTTEEAAEQLDSNESSRDRQNASRDREDSESDDMLVEPQMFEDIRSAQAVDTVRETVCTIIQGLVDPPQSSGDNRHSNEHRENSESEKTSVETSWENMRHDRSLISACRLPEAIRGIEEQPSGVTRVEGDRVITEMSTLEEPEPGSPSETRALPEGVEIRRGHSDGEMTDFQMFHGSHKEPSELNQVGLQDGTEKGFLSDMTVSEEGSQGFSAKDTPIAATPKVPSRLRISEGETSHLFSVIPTPAAKECARVSGKKKCQIDDDIIIPNKVMKKMIEDSSELIAKRRKVPHSDYRERRIRRFADPSKIFWNPLIPYGSLDLQLLFSQPIKLKEPNTTETSPKAAKTARRMKNSSLGTIGRHGNGFSSEETGHGRETTETPQAAVLAELKGTDPETVGNNAEVSAEASSIAPGSAHQTEIAPETPVKTAEPADITPETPARRPEQIDIAPETPARRPEQIDIAPETPVVSEKVEIAPETPVRESMSIRYFNDPETCDKETRPTSSLFDKHPSMFCEDRRDLDAILMNEEVNAHETEDMRQETWSARTRNVAKFFEKTFLEQKEKGKEEKVSLLQLCRGRTQQENARLFYETLVLKTKGYLEVKQEHPYSDILLTRITKQQEAC